MVPNIEAVICSLDGLLDRRLSPVEVLTQIEDIDLALGELQVVVSQIQEHRRALRERRNALAPTAVLGNDALEHVFGFCAPSPETYHLRHTHLAFSHVCRHWRDVALSNPRIWSHLDGRLPRLSMAMLDRVRDAPLSLDIAISGVPDMTYQLVTAALQKHPNFKDVSLCGEASKLKTVLAEMKDPMPFLSNLTLTDVDPEDQVEYCEVSCPGLEDFGAPQLRHLALSFVTIPWNSRCFGNLTVLTIESSWNFSNELLQAVARNTALEKLDLTIWCDLSQLPEDAHDIHGFTTPIALSNLTFLSLKTTSEFLRAVLSSLSLPRLRFLQFENITTCHSLPELSALAAVVCAHHTIQSDVKSLQLSKLSYRNSLRLGININTLHPRPALCGWLNMKEDLFCPFLEDVTNPLAILLRNAPECRVSENMTRELWQPIQDYIPTMSTLRTFSAERMGSNFALDLLDRIDWDSSLTRPFPALRTLHFTSVHLHAMDGRSSKRDGLRRLAACLKRMKECGRDVPVVVLDACSYTADLDDLAVEFDLHECFRTTNDAQWIPGRTVVQLS